MKKKHTHHSKPHESLQDDQAKQLGLIREQIAEVKAKLRKIQQDSISEMQKTLHTAFDEQNAVSLSNLGKQVNHLMQQMDENVKEAGREGAAQPATGTQNAAPEIYPGYNASQQAMNIAREKAAQAMQAAADSAKQAEQALNNLPFGNPSAKEKQTQQTGQPEQSTH